MADEAKAAAATGSDGTAAGEPEALYWVECYTQLVEAQELVLSTMQTIVEILATRTGEEVEEVDIPRLGGNLHADEARREYWRQRAGDGYLDNGGDG
ncbi:MAG: hypothetical protein DLM67_04710 [Candidatus Nephthysia bennettiae]|nr:MAG: hypothetical protein DLM67_04710 [Candidatus Dormibacteraeota bacterium]